MIGGKPETKASSLGVLLVILALCFTLVPGGAWAGLLDDAKRQGWVGEKPDGFAAVVSADAPASVRALVDKVNAGRRAEYERIAKKEGTNAATVGAVFGAKLIERAPPGTYIMRNGKWVRK